MRNSNLLEIDKIILQLKNGSAKLSSAEKKAAVKKLCNYIIEEKGLELNRHHKNPIFDDHNSSAKKEFIVVCLLRLWSSDESLFIEFPDFQRQSLKLIEEVYLSDRRFKDLNIKQSDQSYIKVNKVKDFISGLEEKISSLINFEILNLTQLEDFKKSFLAAIRSINAKVFIHPFLPFDINLKIDNVFSAAKNYINSSKEHKTQTYSTLIADLDRLINEANEFGTAYSDGFIAKCFQKIKLVLNRDFESSPYSKPASLEILGLTKKYPFGQTLTEFKISFVIKNNGTGYAYNTRITIKEFTSESEIEKDKVIGTVGLEESQIDFTCKMLKPAPDTIVELNVAWTNFDGSTSSEDFELILHGQKNKLDWDNLIPNEIYSTEAVETENELIGRREILNLLASRIEGKKVGSAYIYGQRRVGKSSIVKTLKTKLEKKLPRNLIFFYQETGDFKNPNSDKTINQLANNICRKIQNFDSRLKTLPIPEFAGALSPITEYLEQVSAILPECKIVIILDEFDKIPAEMYQKGQIGDSFFETIRAISNKGPYGFLLVGGGKNGIHYAGSKPRGE
ncbi:MAG: hypothetical protein K0S09_630 [Sphingobacteriaceae bacterium]|jgi:hypothetical protein|nr:hypothetical protein [Sphingobacteriaceae bacterium]